MAARGRRELIAVLVATVAPLAGCGSAPAAAPGAEAGARMLTPGAVLSTGLNDAGQLGRDPRSERQDVFGPVTGSGGGGELRAAVALTAGRRHSLAIVRGGRVLAWGANDAGQLGDGGQRGSSAPVAVRAADGADGDLRDAVAVSAGTDFSLALLSDGSVVSWGAGESGQRGTGRVGSGGLTPTAVLGADRKPLSRVVQIAAAASTALAVLDDGTVLGWGGNGAGQLGPGAASRVPLARQVLAAAAPDVRLEGVQQLALGDEHAIALLTDGRVLSWGGNSAGQLGDGTRTDRSQPALVQGVGGRGDLADIVAVSAAQRHTFALRGDGTVVAWGDNSVGQLGVGDTERRRAPVQVVGSSGSAHLERVIMAIAGPGYGAALIRTGAVLTWGSNRDGQLGSGDRQSRSRPTPVSAVPGMLSPIRGVSLAAGRQHLLVLTR